MPRRGHKKSRAGCVDCKRRHVKCDETRPSCVNCKVASLKCSYVKSSNSSQADPRSTAATPAYSPLTPETSTVVIDRQEIRAISTRPAEAINLEHLKLFHHYDDMIYETLTSDFELAKQYRATTISNALRFPFLMYAILAYSALHLRQVEPGQSEHYRSLASSLQAAGLSNLNDNVLQINKDNCVAMFIFATTTGMHSFCDTFSSRDSNFNNVLEKLTSSIQLMRGVRSVMYGGWWDYLQTTPLAGLLASGRALDNPSKEEDEETQPLRKLLGEADLGPASIQTYNQAITDLQRVFNAERTQEISSASVSMVFAWPVMLGSEYNNLLIQRRPEALIILAFYGVILHYHRAAWAVGDAGEYLITSICEYLGKHWEQWLTWPKTVIASASFVITTNSSG